MVSSTIVLTGICLKYFLGRHCCLWCHIVSADLKISLSVRGRQPERSLDTLKLDYTKFMTDGKGNIKVAKLYNNVIEPAMVKISLDKVIKCLNTLSTHLLGMLTGLLPWTPPFSGHF